MLDKKSEIYSCSGGCGRQVEPPAFLKQANIQGTGKIKIVCKKCSKREAYYTSKVKAKP
jgi:hypothetical protein